MIQHDELKQMKKELIMISTYRSLRISMNSLRLFLVGYIVYAMLHTLNSLPPFYILGVTVLLPFILESIIDNLSTKGKTPNKVSTTPCHFPLLRKKYGFKKNSHLSNSITFLFCSILLVLWQIVQNRSSFVYPLLSFYPMVVLLLMFLIRTFAIPYIYIHMRLQLSSGNL